MCVLRKYIYNFYFMISIFPYVQTLIGKVIGGLAIERLLIKQWK